MCILRDSRVALTINLIALLLLVTACSSTPTLKPEDAAKQIEAEVVQTANSKSAHLGVVKTVRLMEVRDIVVSKEGGVAVVTCVLADVLGKPREGLQSPIIPAFQEGMYLQKVNFRLFDKGWRVEPASAVDDIVEVWKAEAVEAANVLMAKFWTGKDMPLKKSAHAADVALGNGYIVGRDVPPSVDAQVKEFASSAEKNKEAEQVKRKQEQEQATQKKAEDDAKAQAFAGEALQAKKMVQDFLATDGRALVAQAKQGFATTYQDQAFVSTWNKYVYNGGKILEEKTPEQLEALNAKCHEIRNAMKTMYDIANTLMIKCKEWEAPLEGGNQFLAFSQIYKNFENAKDQIKQAMNRVFDGAPLFYDGQPHNGPFHGEYTMDALKIAPGDSVELKKEKALRMAYLVSEKHNMVILDEALNLSLMHVKGALDNLERTVNASNPKKSVF